MKTIQVFMAVIFGLVSASAFSAEDSCTKISSLAQEAMAARQSGALLQDSIKGIGDGSKFAQVVVMKAYEKPINQTKDGKAQAIKEFQNEAYRACFNANN